MIGQRRRHVRLHDALTALEETHKIQTIEIPDDCRSVQYYQKYVHTLAQRWNIRVRTRAVRGRGGPAYLILVERD